MLTTLKKLYRFLHPRFQSLFLEYKVDMKPRYGHGKPPHEELFKIIDAHRKVYEDLLHKALAYKDKIWLIQEKATDNSSPTWNNGYLPGLDIIGIYTLLSTYRPRKYIEVGSGYSTKVAYKAKAEQNLPTTIISIDPYPRAEIDILADVVIRQPFENIDLAIIEELEDHDILFIDNSHRILPNSDSMVFFLEILQKLKKGVIVHIHDVYLPYDYPQFMCDRFYTEQYGLAMYLLANPKKFKPILPNYFIFEDKALSDIISPIWNHENVRGVEKHGGSFWLQISE